MGEKVLGYIGVLLSVSVQLMDDLLFLLTSLWWIQLSPQYHSIIKMLVLILSIHVECSWRQKFSIYEWCLLGENKVGLDAFGLKTSKPLGEQGLAV
ncbi:hypothetical protein LguiA_022984 [Lonicera macranthoides]